MKNLYAFFIFSTFPLFLFSQGNITQKLDEIWNPDAGKWDFQQVDNWLYNEQNQEVFYTHEDVFINDFVLEDRRSIEKIYDTNANLIIEIQRNWSDSTWREFRSDHQYDAQNRLIETQNKQTNSYDPEYLFKNRAVYEYHDAENKEIERTYTLYIDSDEWVFNREMTSIFDDNDCLIEKEKTQYNSEGAITNKRKTTWTRDNNCRQFTRIFWLQSQNSNVLELKDKDIYVYSNNGKTTTHTNQQFNDDTNEWDTDFICVTELNDKGQPVHVSKQYLGWQFSDKFLKLYTYNDKGEQTTYHDYRTHNSIGSDELRLVTLDSAIFEYNEEEWLISTKRFTEYRYYQTDFTTINKFKSSTKYAYYCDGQLKSETHENLPNIFRTTYEYDKGDDCHLENNDLAMIVFPNPSDGQIEIRSNLLASSDAAIRIFSTLGQEVFHQKLSNISERLRLDLTYLPNGNYIVSINNGKTIISNKIYILK